jgi:hypothetical protein
VTKESLAKLKPAFAKDGTTHAGNASQVSDGAAAVVLARRSVAQKLGLPILGKYVVSAVVGVPPKVMGIGESDSEFASECSPKPSPSLPSHSPHPNRAPLSVNRPRVCYPRCAAEGGYLQRRRRLF